MGTKSRLKAERRENVTIFGRTWTETLRQDTCNAINLLMQKGKLSPESHYDLRTDERGRPRVWIWQVYPDTGDTIPESVVTVDPVDVIVGAGPLPLVRGTSDSL